MMERHAFLTRVRDRLRGVDAPELPPELPRTPASGDGRPLFDRFAEGLAAVGGIAGLVSRGDLAGAVASVAGGLRAASAVVAPDVEPYGEEVAAGLERAGTAVTRPTDPGGWREAATRAELGVTGGLLAVASTGSVLLASGPGSSRLASLLPPAHLAVLPAGLLVPGFEDLFAAVSGHLGERSGAVLVTGPSRTADIEMTIVRGVHGPRAVHVLLVDGG